MYSPPPFSANDPTEFPPGRFESIRIYSKLFQFLQPNVTVFHLATIAFQPDRTVCGHLKLSVEHFPVASAMSNAVFHNHNDFIPILRLIFFEVLPRTGENVVAALELRTANEHAAVGIGRGAELEFQNKILGKLAGGPCLLYTSPSPRDRTRSRMPSSA